MSFQVSARKYRPQSFETVLGQEHVTVTLKNAIIRERIAHAYLLTGPRGVGKTTTARIIAKSINCLNPQDAEPCNQCANCKAITAGQSIDFIEIDAASNRGIDEVRSLTESVRYSPVDMKYKVYIIDEVHMLTKESFNAFLKTLEEPPEHTIFIFATTDVHKVPITIISRCQRYDFRRIPLDIIKAGLREIADKENITIDDKTLTLIAKKADGGMRDAESFFDQATAFSGDKIEYSSVIKVFNFIDEDIYFEVTDGLLIKDFKMPFMVCDRVYKNGWSFIDFFNGLLEHFRNILSVAATKDTSLLESAAVYFERYKQLAKSFSEGDLLRVMNYLSKLLSELRFSQNHKLRSELALSQLTGFETTETITGLIGMLGKTSAGETIKIERAAPAQTSTPPSEDEKKKSEPTVEAAESAVGLPDAKSGGPVPAVTAESAMQSASEATESNPASETASPYLPGGQEPETTPSPENDLIEEPEISMEFEHTPDDDIPPYEPETPIQIHNQLMSEKKFFASLSKKTPLPEPEKPETDPYVRFIIDKLGGREI